MASPSLQQIHDVFLILAKSAGDMILAADKSAHMSVDTKKNSADPFTQTDINVEAMIDASLRALFPYCEFMGEESHKGSKLTDKPTFIIDPIDGTTNFIHGFPNVCLSLGFCVKQKPVVGVIFNPFTGLLYSAMKGQGSFVRSLGPSSFPNITEVPQQLPLKILPPLPSLQAALVGIEWGSDREGKNWDSRVELFAKLGGSQSSGGGMVNGLRSTGSAAMNMCSVANGQLDVAWEAGAWAWDVCAGWVIVEEAGGRVVNVHPGPTTATWTAMVPPVDGRLYLVVRAAKEEEQKNLVEEIWRLTTMRFEY